ncbi:MAG: winged helix-turn-helix transcriptional regulator [Loktanella sp.]|nr:winged helix-turn-helix transcriptional regulator [Loktanella sp.]
MNHIDAAQIMAADCLCFRARRTARAITRAYDAALHPTGLKATQITLMNAIALGQNSMQPVAKLGETLGLELSTLTRNLSVLERGGLVTVARALADRRVRIVSLTDTGKTRLAAALPHWKEAHTTITAALGSETTNALYTALDRATKALDVG